MDWEFALWGFLGFTGLMVYEVLVWKLQTAVDKRFGDTASFLVWMIGAVGVPVAIGMGVLVAWIQSTGH